VTRFDTVRVAAIQATPVILDADASVDKAIGLLGEAAGQGVATASACALRRCRLAG
jgi:predicted amidohydrolase